MAPVEAPIQWLETTDIQNLFDEKQDKNTRRTKGEHDSPQK
jgi:hypothetical protein